MGAAPGHTTTTPVLNAPVFLPLPAQNPSATEQPTSKAYQIGNASWYGGLFQGKETASGEEYDMNDMTAAHRELPLGSFVRVTNLKNHKVVIVRINDRGPVTPGRIIDLSYNAAKRLEFSGKGIQKVRLDVLNGDAAELAMMKAPATH